MNEWPNSPSANLLSSLLLGVVISLSWLSMQNGTVPLFINFNSSGFRLQRSPPALIDKIWWARPIQTLLTWFYELLVMSPWPFTFWTRKCLFVCFFLLKRIHLEKRIRLEYRLSGLHLQFSYLLGQINLWISFFIFKWRYQQVLHMLIIRIKWENTGVRA